MKGMRLGIISILALLFSVIGVSADNWVCYDATPNGVSESTLRDYFPLQPNSPLQVIRTYSSSSTYTKTAHIRDGDIQDPFSYCPENRYFLETTNTCAQYCTSFSGAHHEYTWNINGGVVTCGLGGSPSCNSWQQTSTCNQEPTKEYVCGQNNNAWRNMNAPGWELPICRELAIRQESEPMLDLSSFNQLSFREYPLFSRSSSDISFVAYVEACLNRVPMMNLRTQLQDQSGATQSDAYGIYARHNTLDYNQENLGLLEDFRIPEQDQFRKTYELQGTLNAYRPWAWRKRLVDGIGIMVDRKGLSVPGYPSEREPQKIGDLYYSADFLQGSNIQSQQLSCDGRTEQLQSYSVNIPGNIPEYGSGDMCTYSDLTQYYEENGFDQNLKDTLRNLFPFDNSDELLSLNIKQKENQLIAFSVSDVTFNVTQLGYDDTEEFMDSVGDEVQDQQTAVENLLDENESFETALYDASFDRLKGLYYYGNSMAQCGDYEPEFLYYQLDGSADFEEEDNQTVSMSADFQSMWKNDIIAGIDVEVEKDFDCSYSWDFANLGNIDSETLAKCLYNWDACLMDEVDDQNGRTYKEVAACGMGPPSDLLDTTLKDAARGENVHTETVSVYKTCENGNDWVSENENYACVDGQTYRCKYYPSLDTISFVDHAKPGDALKTGPGMGFVCKDTGKWEGLTCNG